MHSKANGTSNGTTKTAFNPSKGLRRPRRIFSSQLIGLFQKKFTYTLRKKKLLLAQFVIPPVLLTFAVLLSTAAYKPGSTQPPLIMNASMFKEATSLFTAEDDVRRISSYLEHVNLCMTNGILTVSLCLDRILEIFTPS
jgi:hypothetical protein